MATMRSPNYPQVGLSEAIQLAQQIWDREKRSYAPVSVVVQAWGYGGLNGVARTKLGALNRYGLLERNDSGDVRLSDIAVNILHNPADSTERLDALRRAALLPELFKELQQTYPHASDETVRSYLITKRGFSDTGAENCVEAFRDTQKTAKLDAVETQTSPIAAQTRVPAPSSYVPQYVQSTQRPYSFHPAYGEPIERKQAQPNPISGDPDDMTTFSWPLARGVVAQVRFLGEVKAIHLDLLKQYLDVAKGAMETDEAEGRVGKHNLSFTITEQHDES